MKVDKRYLDVPFRDKDKVKKLGGKWDPIRKQWWVPLNVPICEIERWNTGEIVKVN
jgi:hypothetical protein